MAFVLCCVAGSVTSHAALPEPVDDDLVVKKSKATGTANLVKGKNGIDIPVPLPPDKTVAEPIDFFETHGPLFAIRNSQAQLAMRHARTDILNHQHTTYQQVHEGVPVFGAVVRVHMNPNGKFRTVSGCSVDGIKVNPVPTLTADEGSAVGINRVLQQAPKGANLLAVGTTLYIYRTNLARGVPGDNHLVWEVEVTDGRSDHRHPSQYQPQNLQRGLQFELSRVAGGQQPAVRRPGRDGNQPVDRLCRGHVQPVRYIEQRHISVL
jgi:hypothetical protein